MRDIAAHLGVSAMTVSRVLSDPERVSPALRERVEAAIRQIGYVPNRVAGSLSARRSNIIGLLLPSIRNSLFSATMSGISDTLHGAGFQLMIADAGYDPRREEALVRAFIAQRVAGLILHETQHTATTREMLQAADIPVVEIGNLTPRPIGMVVSFSNFEASRAMTAQLLARGYRRIALVTMPLSASERSRDRREGYLAALQSAGIEPDPSIMLEVPPGPASGREAIARLVNRADPADAGFMAGNALALGAVLECQRRGWEVPGRIAIASFDDNVLLAQTVPPVTAVRLPRLEIGRRGTQALLARIGGHREPVALDLGFEIIFRAST